MDFNSHQPFNSEGNNDYNRGYNNGYSPNNQEPFYDKPLKYPKFIPISDWNIEKNRIKKLSISAALGIFVYLIISAVLANVYSVIMMALGKQPFEPGSTSMMFYMVIYSIICVGLAFFLIYKYLSNKGFYYKPISFEKPKNTRFIPYYIIIALAVCFVGDIITSVLALFSETIATASQTADAVGGVPDSVWGIILFFLSNAIIPALIEEFAIRGVIMQPLRRYGDEFAIIASSLVFGLMHCNLVQIPFAFCAGAVFGYIAIVTDSLWIPIIVHSLNNGYSCLMAILVNEFGEQSLPVLLISGIIFYGIIGLGIFLFFKYKNIPSRPHIRMSGIINSGKNYYKMTAPFSAKISYGTLAKTYLLNPAMIIAIIFVAIQTFLS